ncbi:MAG TPA: serine hydrolase [Candidatus Acidoferrales bacterium]|nr:serine hydrolase [Candidatus Acidoferrales bacterium]
MSFRPRGGWISRVVLSAVFSAIPFVCASAAARRAHSATVTHASTRSTSAAKPAIKHSSSAKKVSARTVAHTSRPTRVSRHARLARARAAAAYRARLAASRQRQLERTEFKRDSNGNLIPKIRAAAAIVFNPSTGVVLWEEHSKEQRSIASLTKLMTSVVFLADDPDMTRVVEVTRPDVTNASVTHLRAGDQVELGELLHLMLIASDNGAARVLARTSDGSTPAFVDRMNTMAQFLGLANTHYEDPTGLDANDVSTAYDISHLIAFASSDETIGPIIRTEKYDVRTVTRVIPIHSTNKLLGTGIDVRGGKTGFINKAGYCLATLLQIPQGNQIAVVVLGAGSSSMRFWDTRRLLSWASANSQLATADPVTAAK